MATAREPKQHCLTAKRATTFAARLVGLMLKANPPPESGLLLTPCRSVHTCFMRFPLDVVFLDADFRVAAVVLRLPPWRFVGSSSAWQVLELRAGEVERLGIQCGDTLLVQDS